MALLSTLHDVAHSWQQQTSLEKHVPVMISTNVNHAYFARLEPADIFGGEERGATGQLLPRRKFQKHLDLLGTTTSCY